MGAKSSALLKSVATGATAARVSSRRASTRSLHYSSQDTNHWVEYEKDGYRIRALAPFARFRGLEIPWENPLDLDATSERVVKLSGSRKVVKLSAGQFGLPVEVYVKRYNFRSWMGALLRTGRKSRALEEFEVCQQLGAKGFKTPRVVWLAESRGAVARYSVLATEALPAAESAEERWGRCTTETQRRLVLTAIAELMRKLHDANFYHDSFTAGHLLIFPNRPSAAGEFHIVDLRGSRFFKVLTRLRRAKNLYQMLRSFNSSRLKIPFTAEHRKILLTAYSGSPKEAEEWSAWVERAGQIKRLKFGRLNTTDY